MAQVVGPHDAQDGAKELGHVGEAARTNARLDARAPEAGIMGILSRFEEPLLPFFQRGEPPLENALRRIDQRTYSRVEIPAGAHFQTGGRLSQTPEEVGIVVDLRLQNGERSGRALLP